MDFLLLIFLYLMLCSLALLCYINANSYILKHGPVGWLRDKLRQTYMLVWLRLPAPVRYWTTRVADHIFFESSSMTVHTQCEPHGECYQYLSVTTKHSTKLSHDRNKLKRPRCRSDRLYDEDTAYVESQVAYIKFVIQCFWQRIFIFLCRNCIFQALYASLVIVGHAVVIADGMPYLYAVYPQTNHLLEPLVLFALNTVFFIICCKSDPGEITADSVKYYSQIFQPDGILYREQNKCPTCQILKPARSKHCAVYNRCIFKFDHYCAWTNNCVGGLNHRYFLVFLVSICVMCGAGVRLSFNALAAITHVHQLRMLHFLDTEGHPQPMNIRVLVQTLFMQFPRLVFLAVSLTVITVFILAFTLYHCYLVLSNQTTNERYKKHYLKTTQPKLQISNPYSYGIWRNIREEFYPLWNEKSKRKKKCR